MSNIYNKKIITRDGTLIDNWFEEGELRIKTGEGRSIQGTNFGKITFDPEVLHTDTNPRNDTFKRVIGKKEPQKGYKTTYMEYGKDNDEILPYTHPKLSVKDDLEKLNIYVKNSNLYGEEAKKCDQEFRSFETTNKSLHPTQPFREYIGLRHMLTQDLEPIPREKAINFIPIEIIKKMGQEAAEQEFEEKKRKKEEMKRMAEKFKQKKMMMEQSGEDSMSKEEEEERSSFWLNNINTGDVYRSFIKGNNPWAKSSGFTQLLQNTRGAFQYYQNVKDSPLSESFVKAIEEDKKMREEFKKKEKEEAERLAKIDEEIKKKNKGLVNTLGIGGGTEENSVLPQIEGQEIPTKVSDETIDKILKGCSIRGWIGLRALKCYLRNLSAHKSEIIDKNAFKYFFAKQAILLNDNDVDTIYAVHDKSKSDYINYINFLNSITRVSETRKAQIESFKEQVKAPGQNYILFSNLISLADMNYHPEAVKFLKTVPDLDKEYAINWDNLKEDNRVTENDFKQFFYDVSSCVEKDADFTQILKALGYK